ncbi:hypothetical protein GWK47_042894 [Chionoecetes opilio]|uniref:Uncharacterized protein n=1 Tax=Chionoecetes opilio TaxID=41210 RepID=A0A8J4YFM6_CHIOP|nr:hypothetical protein GWK47_042894 [Chionoecetes opilio]
MTRRRLHCLPHTIRTRLVSGSPPRVIPYHQCGNIYCCLPPLASPALTSPFTTDEMGPALSTLRPGKLRAGIMCRMSFLLHMTPPPLSPRTLLFPKPVGSGASSYVLETSTLLPIPKPGKDPTLPFTYRPITLLSCVGKLLERPGGHSPILVAGGWPPPERGPVVAFRPARST